MILNVFLHHFKNNTFLQNSQKDVWQCISLFTVLKCIPLLHGPCFLFPFCIFMILPGDWKILIFHHVYLVWIHPVLSFTSYFLLLKIAVLYYIAICFPLQAFVCFVICSIKKKLKLKIFLDNSTHASKPRHRRTHNLCIYLMGLFFFYFLCL